MCGIIGIIGKAPVAPLLIEGLKRLEYRGYDSSGVATLVNGHIERRRAEGKIARLEALVGSNPLAGTIGIGHTRWATHGRPSETNAHPHATDRVAVVHNGIIENFQELREELEGLGREFETETDTEVVAHLLTHLLEQQKTPQQAMTIAMDRLKGAFALGVIFAGRSDLMIGARRGSPLAVGYGDGEMYIGSDALALAPFTSRICYLEENDWVVVTSKGGEIFNGPNKVEREIKQTAMTGARVGKGNFRHFMLKEIYEQPAVIGDTLQRYVNPLARTIEMPALPFDFATLPRLTIVACGTAYLAGMVAKYWFEQIARVPVELDIASEFRYREAPLPKGGATMVISQSGETIDTLAALRYAKSQGQKILSVLNVPESTIARESDLVLPTLAGPEIGVASTKAFTTQLTVLACLAISAARARGAIDHKRETELSQALLEVPARAAEVLNHDESIRRIAYDIAETRDVLFLGRGTSYPIALEGALKLKEMSQTYTQAFHPLEYRHGP
ncbi:MAG: glutamine--fructose-6-phosphate transaminase (isomerizing), partial [Hypericibacter sp.]